MERQLKILLIDDNPQILQFFSAYLEGDGRFIVSTATDGANGLAAFEAHRPDCVVIDVAMPTLDGVQLTRALRGDITSAETALIMLTAMVQEQDEIEGLASGIDLYMHKPVTPDELIVAIYTAMQRNEDDRERNLRDLAEGL